MFRLTGRRRQSDWATTRWPVRPSAPRPLVALSVGQRRIMTPSRESPVATEADSANHSPERAEPATRAMPSILVVDDEPNIVDLLVLALEDEGYHVASAYDGEQAWRLVRQHQPDLIISDVSMPRLNGLDLFDRLQERRQLARIPVILMSAVRRTVDRPGAVFIPKPFDLGGLLDLVQAKLAVA